MRRVAWLLLAFVGAAFVRVQPVELLDGCHCVCGANCHCKVPGTCGMPCCGAPASANPTLATEQASVAGLVRSRPAARALRLRAAQAFVFQSDSAQAASGPAGRARAVLTARAPLYRLHCSFLI